MNQRTKQRVTLVAAAICWSFMIACSTPDGTPATTRSTAAGNAQSVARPSTPREWPDRYGLGSPASAAHIALIDTDIDTTGAGLPAGQGTPSEGAMVYASKCAGCHGNKGEGIAPSPVLVAPIIPADSFPWASKAGAPKTVGNYWPFATTLFQYVRDAMPSAAPGSLSSTEVYQVVAYLLAENGVIARNAVLDAQTLPAIKLPMRGRLVIDTRRGGAEVR
ncbi:MAG: c-type cytochrome [Gemmatimonas sp.]